MVGLTISMHFQHILDYRGSLFSIIFPGEDTPTPLKPLEVSSALAWRIVPALIIWSGFFGCEPPMKNPCYGPDICPSQSIKKEDCTVSVAILVCGAVTENKYSKCLQTVELSTLIFNSAIVQRIWTKKGFFNKH